LNERGRLIDIVILCIAGVILPALLFIVQLERVQSIALQGEISGFAEEIATHGYIDCLMHESFLDMLGVSGEKVMAEFYVEHETLAPEYVMRTVDNAESYLDGLFSGSNVLTQDKVVTLRPPVYVPGIPPDGAPTENVVGADTSTTGPLITHGHTEMCYAGTKHQHGENCPSKRVRCSAGCSLHEHIGSASLGTGCYTGEYVEPIKKYCGSITIIQSTVSTSTLKCNEGHQKLYYRETYLCNGCGEETSSAFYRCECWPGNDEEKLSHYLYFGGGYSLDCTKSLSTYYKGNSICRSCSGSGYVETTACTKVDGNFYDENGTVCWPLCDKVVMSLTPIVREQLLRPGDSPDVRAKAVFADGHSEIVSCNMTGFDDDLYCVIQNITLSYGSYSGSLLNKESTSCTVKVFVGYAEKTCMHGHLYYLIDGDNTTCPYCKVYPRMLTVIGISENPLCITKGSSLADNGVRVKITYYDGHETIISNGWVDNFDKNYVGEQKVTIGYQGAETTLVVKTQRVKVRCCVCGYAYFLYPDNTDPGCPRCLSEVPVFTGKVLRYTETISHNEIMDELYQGEGIYYFTRGDRLMIQLWKNGWRTTDAVIGERFRRNQEKELISMYSVEIRDEKPRR